MLLGRDGAPSSRPAIGRPTPRATATGGWVGGSAFPWTPGGLGDGKRSGFVRVLVCLSSWADGRRLGGEGGLSESDHSQEA